MESIFGVVRHLKKELERPKAEVERYGAALVALGSSKLGGQRCALSAAARRKISLAQKARRVRQNMPGGGQTQIPRSTLLAKPLHHLGVKLPASPSLDFSSRILK
jgi:hypothetical protein